MKSRSLSQSTNGIVSKDVIYTHQNKQTNKDDKSRTRAYVGWIVITAGAWLDLVYHRSFDDRDLLYSSNSLLLLVQFIPLLKWIGVLFALTINHIYNCKDKQESLSLLSYIRNIDQLLYQNILFRQQYESTKVFKYWKIGILSVLFANIIETVIGLSIYSNYNYFGKESVLFIMSSGRNVNGSMIALFICYRIVIGKSRKLERYCEKNKLEIDSVIQSKLMIEWKTSKQSKMNHFILVGVSVLVVSFSLIATDFVLFVNKYSDHNTLTYLIVIFYGVMFTFHIFIVVYAIDILLQAVMFAQEKVKTINLELNNINDDYKDFVGWFEYRNNDEFNIFINNGLLTYPILFIDIVAFATVLVLGGLFGVFIVSNYFSLPTTGLAIVIVIILMYWSYCITKVHTEMVDEQIFHQKILKLLLTRNDDYEIFIKSLQCAIDCINAKPQAVEPPKISILCLKLKVTKSLLTRLAALAISLIVSAIVRIIVA